MPDEIDVHAILLRAEAKALKRLEEVRAACGAKSAMLADFEEVYARAVAIRKNWEACELRASKENQSGSSFVCPWCGKNPCEGHTTTA